MANIIRLGSLYLNDCPAEIGLAYKPGKTISIGETAPGKEIHWVVVNDMLIADRCILTEVSWDDLNAQNLVFGKRGYYQRVPLHGEADPGWSRGRGSERMGFRPRCRWRRQLPLALGRYVFLGTGGRNGDSVFSCVPWVHFGPHLLLYFVVPPQCVPRFSPCLGPSALRHPVAFFEGHVVAFGESHVGRRPPR